MFNIETGLSMLGKVADLWRAGKANSYIDYTKPARVEPVTLIDGDCLYSDALPDVMQSVLSIFTGYYMQALAISMSIGKIDVRKSLDKLNPNRDVLDSAIDNNYMGYLATESYRDSLPTFKKMETIRKIALENDINPDSTFQLTRDSFEKEADYVKYLENKETLEKNYKLNVEKFGQQKAMDEFKKQMEASNYGLNKDRFEAEMSASTIAFGRDTVREIKELANLSVGKMITVDITDGTNKGTMPIAIRLMASTLPTASIVHILSHYNKDNSLKERYYAWKSGRIEFIRDFVLCLDLIKEHRREVMKDKDGVYSNILARARRNKLSTIVSGNPSVATASNIVIISAKTAEQLELHLNGKLRDFKIREKMFESTYIMILVVIDQSWNRVTFYHNGINDVTEVGMKDLKVSNKGDGVNITDVLKSYAQGLAPSL